MRMNTNRLMNDDEDEEYIRRPMSSLMTSTTPAASSNIIMISSTDIPSTQATEKQNKTKKQSVPNSQDFPALPSTNTTQNTGKDMNGFLIFPNSISNYFSSDYSRCLDSWGNQCIGEITYHTTEK